MFFLVDNCSPVQVGGQGKVSLVSNFLLWSRRWRQTTKDKKLFFKRRSSPRQPAAHLLSLHHLPQSHPYPPHLPQMKPHLPRKHPLSSPDKKGGARDHGPFLTMDSCFPGNIPSPRKSESFFLRKGVQIHCSVKTALVMMHTWTERALKAAAWMGTFRPGGSGPSLW